MQVEFDSTWKNTFPYSRFTFIVVHLVLSSAAHKPKKQGWSELSGDQPTEMQIPGPPTSVLLLEELDVGTWIWRHTPGPFYLPIGYILRNPVGSLLK